MWNVLEYSLQLTSPLLPNSLTSHDGGQGVGWWCPLFYLQRWKPMQEGRNTFWRLKGEGHTIRRHIRHEARAWGHSTNSTPFSCKKKKKTWTNKGIRKKKADGKQTNTFVMVKADEWGLILGQAFVLLLNHKIVWNDPPVTDLLGLDKVSWRADSAPGNLEIQRGKRESVFSTSRLLPKRKRSNKGPGSTFPSKFSRWGHFSFREGVSRWREAKSITLVGPLHVVGNTRNEEDALNLPPILIQNFLFQFDSQNKNHTHKRTHTQSIRYIYICILMYTYTYTYVT